MIKFIVSIIKKRKKYKDSYMTKWDESKVRVGNDPPFPVSVTENRVYDDLVSLYDANNMYLFNYYINARNLTMCQVISKYGNVVKIKSIGEELFTCKEGDMLMGNVLGEMVEQ